MREIKFRAWDKVNNVMVYDVDVTNGRPVKKGYQWFNTKNTVYDSELMQYTGLKDKNGKEIYEGDTVLWKRIIYEDCSREKIDRIEIHEGEIVWFKNAWHLKKGRFYMPLFWFDEEKDEMEVKGNSFENPELLRE